MKFPLKATQKCKNELQEIIGKLNFRIQSKICPENQFFPDFKASINWLRPRRSKNKQKTKFFHQEFRQVSKVFVLNWTSTESTLRSFREFRPDENDKAVWEWDASYEESAKCQTASDQGDTHHTNFSNHPNKENITGLTLDSTLLGTTLERLPDDGNTVNSLEFSVEEKSFVDKHFIPKKLEAPSLAVHPSPVRKLAKPCVEVQNSALGAVSLSNALAKGRQTILQQQSMDISGRSPSKIPRYVQSPARKKPKTSLSPMPVFKTPFLRHQPLPKELEMDKENISALFDAEAAANRTTCNFHDMDFDATIKGSEQQESINKLIQSLESPSTSLTFEQQLESLKFSFEGKKIFLFVAIWPWRNL